MRQEIRPLVALKIFSRFLAKASDSMKKKTLELILIVLISAKTPFRSAKDSAIIGGINFLLLAKDLARLFVKLPTALTTHAIECIAYIAYRVGKNKVIIMLEESMDGFT